MKLKSIIILILLSFFSMEVYAQTFFSWRYREDATDCTSLTDGKQRDLCYELDDDTLYKCDPTAGDCDTAGEWKAVSGGGSGTITQVGNTTTGVAGTTASNTDVTWTNMQGTIGKVTTSDASFTDVTASGDILPDSDDSSNLGGSGIEFKDIYIDGVAFVDQLDMHGNANFVDTGRQNFGAGSGGSGFIDVRFGYQTADANAKLYYGYLDKAGDSPNNVPVFLWGDVTGKDANLGLFDGITQPRIAVLDDDADSAISLGFTSDDVAGIVGNGNITSLDIQLPLTALDATFSFINDTKIGNASAADATFTDITTSSLTASECVQTDANKKLISTGGSCGGTLTVGNSIASGTAQRVIFEDASNNIAEDADFTFDGVDTLTITNITAIDATFTNIGKTSTGDATFNTVTIDKIIAKTSLVTIIDPLVLNTSGSGTNPAAGTLRLGGFSSSNGISMRKSGTGVGKYLTFQNSANTTVYSVGEEGKVSGGDATFAFINDTKIGNASPADATFTAIGMSGGTGTITSISGDLNLDANGQNITLGDGGITNYISITDSGVMTFVGSSLINTTFSATAIVPDLAAADDNFELFTSTRAITIKWIGCHTPGTATLAAEISLEDRSGNAMTHDVHGCTVSTNDTTG